MSGPMTTFPPPIVELVPPSVDVEVFLIPGPQGPPGPPGPAGTGDGGGATPATYVHHQVEPTETWTIVHNLGRVVSPTLVLDNPFGEIVYTDVEVVDLNTVVAYFPSPRSGYAYL